MIRGLLKWQSSLTAMRTHESLMIWMRTWIFAALNSVSSTLLTFITSPMKIGELIWRVSVVTTAHGDQNIITIIKGKTK